MSENDILWRKEYTLEEAGNTAFQLLQKVSANNLLISGGLGAGKTTLVSAIIRQLGSIDHASSPTFGWVHPYIDSEGETVAYHFDNYRIESYEDANEDELWDYYRQDIPILMEWPEKLTYHLWPEDYHWVQLETLAINVRLLVLYRRNIHPQNSTILPIND